MKKLYTLAAMMLVSVASALALEPYNPPEFIPEDWNYLGEGIYSPGVFDWLGNEYPYDLPAKIWESKAEAQVYWVEPDGTKMKPFEPEYYEGDTWLECTKAFIVYAQNEEQVYTSPIYTMHPAIFCVYHQVPEIMGIMGSSQYYGQKDNLVISFPANSYKMLTVPTGSPTTNTAGSFGVVLPDPSGIETVEVNNTAATEYYNLQGMKIANPERGNIYILKNGKNSKKVIF